MRGRARASAASATDKVTTMGPDARAPSLPWRASALDVASSVPSAGAGAGASFPSSRASCGGAYPGAGPGCSCAGAVRCSAGIGAAGIGIELSCGGESEAIGAICGEGSAAGRGSCVPKSGEGSCDPRVYDEGLSLIHI